MHIHSDKKYQRQRSVIQWFDNNEKSHVLCLVIQVLVVCHFINCINISQFVTLNFDNSSLLNLNYEMAWFCIYLYLQAAHIDENYYNDHYHENQLYYSNFVSCCLLVYFWNITQYLNIPHDINNMTNIQVIRNADYAHMSLYAILINMNRFYISLIRFFRIRYLFKIIICEAFSRIRY